MKIHYVNEMADFCECSGADIREVAKGMGLDSRIGKNSSIRGPVTADRVFRKIPTQWRKWAKIRFASQSD